MSTLWTLSELLGFTSWIPELLPVMPCQQQWLPVLPEEIYPRFCSCHLRLDIEYHLCFWGHHKHLIIYSSLIHTQFSQLLVYRAGRKAFEDTAPCTETWDSPAFTQHTTRNQGNFFPAAHSLKQVGCIIGQSLFPIDFQGQDHQKHIL